MSAELCEFRPDASSVTPLYLQLVTKLSEGIRRGLWQPEEALPSERTLSDTLAVSRHTARKAIEMLCERGMLTRKRGSGTYLTHRPTLQPRLSRLTNFSEELRQRGCSGGSHWLSRETGVASPEEMLALGLSPNSPVSRLKRLRTANDVVIAIESSTIPAQYLPDPTAVTDSLYGYLEARHTAPARALQHIRAVNASAEQARLTGFEPGAAMLYITRVGYLADGAAIELTHSHCHSDHYDFVAELRR